MSKFAAKLKKVLGAQVDLTDRHLFKNLIVFTLPIVLLSLLQLIYTEADQLVVNYYGGGYRSFVAVSTNGPLINLIIALFVGLSVGANVVLAKAKGKDDKEKGERTLHMAMFLSLITGIGAGIIGFFASPSLLKVMKVDESVFDKATTYLRLYFAGLPFLMIFNYGSALLRAMGDSKRPLYTLIIFGIVNIGLNFLFVLAFDMDVAGVGLATVICEAGQAVTIVLFLIFNKHAFVRFSFKKLFKIHGTEIKEILVNGVPAGLQSLAFTFSNVFVQTSINSFGLAVTAGFAASSQVESFIYMIMNGFSVAVVSIAAQNVGAKNKRNINRILWYALGTVTVLGLLVGGIFAIFRKDMISIFLSQNSVDSPEELATAKQMGVERLVFIGLTYFLCGIMDAEGAYCRGLGHSIAPAVISLIGVSVTRILFIETLFRFVPEFHTPEWISYSWALAWVITSASYWIVIPKYRREAMEKIDRTLPNNKEIYDLAKESFKARFGLEPEMMVFSPGRLEVIGNHTDHQGGKCLVAGCSLGIYGAIAKRDDGMVEIISEGFEPVIFSVKDLINDEKGSSMSLVKGVLYYLKEQNHIIGGFSASFTNDIPVGAGISSSAAYELMIAECVNSLYNAGNISKEEKAQAGRFAENVYFGKPCGLLDQIGSSYGNVNLVDFKEEKPSIKSILFPKKWGLNIVLVNPGSSHEGLTGLYASIPEDMKAVAKALGHERLSDIENPSLDSLDIPQPIKDRAIHYFNEVKRVDMAYKAIKSKDKSSFLACIKEGQESQDKLLRNTLVPNEYENSPQEAIDLAKPILDRDGASRVMGGGFKGVTLNFVPNDKSEEFTLKMKEKYGDGSVINVRIVEGCHRL